MHKRPAPSLRGRALMWLAQRDQSRQELEKKLSDWARLQARARERERERAQSGLLSAEPAETGEPEVDESESDEFGGLGEPFDVTEPPGTTTAPLRALLQSDEPDHGPQAIKALLDDLQAAGHLSDSRFVESRVHARQARFGNRRIQAELRQHGLALGAAQNEALRQSELARAVAVRERRYGALPQTATERARQARFLAARGFSADAIRQALQHEWADLDLDVASMLDDGG